MKITGTHIGRVKVIFTLPKAINAPGSVLRAPVAWPTLPLAYVEWYTKPVLSPNQTHGMYQVTKATDSQGRTSGAIIPLSNIHQSCMLFPSFKGKQDELISDTLQYNNILDKFSTFFVNNWLNQYSYQTIY